MYGDAVEVASSADKTFSYIPDCSDLDIPEDADYVYICETIRFMEPSSKNFQIPKDIH